MNRKERRRQWALRERREKAWEEANQFAEEVMVRWVKEGGYTPVQIDQMCQDLGDDFIDAINYRRAPVGLVRCVLVHLMARSLADQATDLDRLAEDAALFGKVLVDTALNLYTPQQQ